MRRSVTFDQWELSGPPGKKTAEAVQQEVAREVSRLLEVIFQDRRKGGSLDLEALETAIRIGHASGRRYRLESAIAL